MKRNTIIVIAALLTLPVTAGEKIAESAAANANGLVDISNPAGELSIVGWNKNEIKITGELGDNVEQLVFEVDGDRAVIKVVYPKKRNLRLDPSELQVMIPNNSDLKVHVVSSDVEVSDVRGEQHLLGVSADINTQAFESEIGVQVISGDITVNGTGKAIRLDLTTVSGDVEVHDVQGELDFSSVSGDLVAESKELLRVSAKTTNGDIIVNANLIEGGRLDAHTVNGNVGVSIDNADGLYVDIQTLSGDIASCFGESSERTSEYGPGRVMRFGRGEADRKVSIETLNGDVDICI